MKIMTLLMSMVVAGSLAAATRASETDQLKSDLVGQCMGGREKCWRFQSVDQIKELAVQKKTEDSKKRVYTVALRLQATGDSAKYSAEARVEYVNTALGWKIKQVGLLTLKKLE